MEAFRWNKHLYHWHLYDKYAGIHCYLIKVESPMSPSIRRLPYETDIQTILNTYIMLDAVTDEDGTWSWRVNSFNSIYEALTYGTELLGYVLKFRDPSELEEETC